MAKAPSEFPSEAQAWFGDRTNKRGRKTHDSAALPPQDREIPT
jgi:hypothetical protein